MKNKPFIYKHLPKPVTQFSADMTVKHPKEEKEEKKRGKK